MKQEDQPALWQADATCCVPVASLSKYLVGMLPCDKGLAWHGVTQIKQRIWCASGPASIVHMPGLRCWPQEGGAVQMKLPVCGERGRVGGLRI